MPPYTSATLGVGFPSHGLFATPFVVTAPSLFKSTNSLYSAPEPNVPDATVTGFFHSTPATFTDILLITAPPPSHQTQVPPCIYACCSHCCEHPCPLSCIRRQDMHQFHMPCAPPLIQSSPYHALQRKP